MPRIAAILLIILFTFQVTVYGQVDTTIGLTSPGNLAMDANAIASYLTIDLKTEKEKANAIYNWVTHNISYDVEALKKFPKDDENSVEHVLKTRKATGIGYSILFTELCRAAGLKAVTIEGYAKDWVFDNGDEMHIPRHQWSAVKISGKWELVEPTWGAGVLTQSPGRWGRLMNKVRHKGVMTGKELKFKPRYDTQYFMQDPEEFRLKHVPSDPLWQLTDSAMPLALFVTGDSAIQSFNELYSRPKQDDPRLDRISTLDDKQKIYEFADRAYAYNNRYVVVQAVKNTIRVEAVVNRVITDSTIESGDIMLRDAVNDLKSSLGYIKEQKKAFPEEYNKLRKKNKDKTLEARQYFRQIRADNKRFIADCNKHLKTIEDKRNAVGKGTKTQQVNAAAEHANLYSVAPLDAALVLLQAEDSVLALETNARIEMHDNYDNEVKMYSEMYRMQKQRIFDTILKSYFDSFEHMGGMPKDNDAYLAYLKEVKTGVQKLQKQCRKQISIIDYMEKAEANRQALEDRSISKKKAFDVKENDNMKAATEKGIKDLEHVVNQLNDTF